MTTLSKFVAFAGMSLAAFCAIAADQQAQLDLNPENVVTVTSRHYVINGDDFIYLGGTYGLDNGATLRFSKFGSNRYFASVGDLPQTEVFAVAENRFVARDKSIQMVFKPHDSGMSTGVTVQYANPRMTQAGMPVLEYLIAKN